MSSPVTNSTLVYRRLARALLEELEKIEDLDLFKGLLADIYTNQELIKRANKLNPKNAQPLAKLPLQKTATIVQIKDVISVSDAMRFVTNPPPILARSKDYLNFEQVNSADIQTLIDNLKLGQSKIGVEWLKITFFMLSRIDGEWTHSATGGLRESQLNAISEFITLETNKGVKMDAPEESGTDTDTEPETEGKDSSEQPVSIESTGKLKKDD